MSRAANVFDAPYISRNGPRAKSQLPENAQDTSTNAFPYLEAIAVTAKKNPYAMLGAMIGVAAIIITAVTTFSIAIFTGAFLLYGKMSGMEVSQHQILEKLTDSEQEVKVLRTYEASVLARQNYIAGLMDRSCAARNCRGRLENS